jgi:hypothetical protein
MLRMEIHSKPLTASSVVRRLGKGEIDLAPEYQRGKVWSRRRQALLIDSMLRGYDLPKFYVRQVEEGPEEVVDGQQRLTAIAAYFADEVALPKGPGPTAGKRHSQLPSELQDSLDDFQLHFTVISKAGEDEVREMFLRLQMGVKLNAAEELNAVAGGMHDFVAELAKLPLFMSKIAFSNNRGAHRHVAAQLARLAVLGMGDVRKPDLLQLFRTHAVWTPDEHSKKLRRVLAWSANAFDDKDAALRNRGQAVSLMWATYSLWDDLDFQGHEGDVHEAFRRLDEEHVSDNRAYSDYRVALSHSSDQRKSIETRHRFVVAAIAQWAPNLPRRDPKRAFSADERAAIYYRDGGRCQAEGCGVDVPFTDFHADHVLAWTHGGFTTLANGQVLCSKHNLSKGAS